MKWLNAVQNRTDVCSKCSDWDEFDRVAPALEWRRESNGDQTRRCPNCGVSYGRRFAAEEPRHD